MEAASEEEELHNSSQDIGLVTKDVPLRERLMHLTPDRREQFALASQLSRFPDAFGDSPGLTTWAVHDIAVGDFNPINLPPYRTPADTKGTKVSRLAGQK
ncbi:hypothetical protein Pcinc_044153 [Petrolisthes cinctipes]|uniref:Uncharacterized protein n=1 Tax=Petrolisthes cinctipes TaxID=88211 RepID=A0AAE1BEU6_PETCI|nr:hypothetical protein Pcinc_044153 [Petrolisthes cinctipes]